jgi:hypothetical protein
MSYCRTVLTPTAAFVTACPDLVSLTSPRRMSVQNGDAGPRPFEGGGGQRGFDFGKGLRGAMLALGCILLAAFFQPALQAQSYTVTLNTDANPSGGGNSGDLRYGMTQAIKAVASSGTYTINFNCGSPCQITLGAMLPNITSAGTINIVGGNSSSANTIIDGNSKYRIFNISGGTINLSYLQLQNALAQGGKGVEGSTYSIPGSWGGGGGGGGGLGAGACIYLDNVNAILNIENAEFYQCKAVGGQGGSSDIGSPSSGYGGGLDGATPTCSEASEYSAVYNETVYQDTVPFGYGGSGGSSGCALDDYNGGDGSWGGGGGGASNNGSNIQAGTGGYGGGNGGVAASSSSFGGGYGGGGGAFGPAIFVHAGTLNIQGSKSIQSISVAGDAGSSSAGSGTADSTPVYLFNGDIGSVNGSTTRGPQPGAIIQSASLTGELVVTLNTDNASIDTNSEDANYNLPGLGPGAPGDLRYALQQALYYGGTNTIIFNFTNCPTPCTITLQNPLPPITGDSSFNLTIDGGTFGNVIIDGNSLNGATNRVFFVDSGTVTLANLQIQNAIAKGGAGGISAGGGLGAGGGLFVNQSTANVIVRNTYFFQCAAIGGAGGETNGYDAGGGGGMAFSGAYNAGGGGILSPGQAFASESDDSGGQGGSGGGGGAGAKTYGSSGGVGYGGNPGGQNANSSGAGAGGFGGGGGGGGNAYFASENSAGAGGAGGFGGGGGAGASSYTSSWSSYAFYPGGIGGFGGGGGGDFSNSAISGGFGGGSGNLAGGGGAAFGPAIFVNQGTLTTVDSGASGLSAIAGLAGSGGDAGNGTADQTPVYVNAGGTVNGTVATAPGPVTTALCGSAPSTGPFNGLSVTSTGTINGKTEIQAGTIYPLTVTAVDTNGQTYIGYTGTVNLTSTNPLAIFDPSNLVELFNPNQLNLNCGVAQYVWSYELNAAGSGYAIAATDSNSASITGTAVTGSLTNITVDPLPETQLVLAAPSTVAANAPFGITVTAEDIYGNTVPTSTDSLTFSTSDSVSTLPTGAALVGGTGGFTADLAAPGASINLTVTDKTNSSVTAGSATIAVTDLAAPLVSLSVLPDLIASNSNAATTLNVTVTNPNAAAALSGVKFTVTYPEGVNALEKPTSNSCGSGNFVSGQFSFVNMQLSAASSCTIQIPLKANLDKKATISATAPTSIESAAGSAVEAPLYVGMASITTLTMTEGGSVAIDSGGSITPGNSLTLTARATQDGNYIQNGLVKFCDGAAAIANCTDIHLLGTAQLTSEGKATVRLTPGIGSHSYTAIFVGTPNCVTSIAPQCGISTVGSVSAASTLTVTGTFQTSTGISGSGSAGDYSLTGVVTGLVNSVNVAPLSGTVDFDEVTGGLAVAQGTLGSVTSPLLSLTDIVDTGAGATPTSIAVSDFNGDGIADVAVTNYQSNTVTILLGMGAGWYTQTPTTTPLGNVSPLTVGGNPSFVAVGDFNGDGIPDLAVVNNTGDTVTILLGRGDGSFSEATATYLSSYKGSVSPIAVGSAPSSVAVGDFNGDGVPDLAVTDSLGSKVTILLGRGDGTFTEATSTYLTTALGSTSPIAAGSLPQYVAVGDFNGDGIPDLAVANNGGNSVTILLGRGDGSFTEATSSYLSTPLGSASPIAVGYGPESIAVGDFNGDGIPDLAIANNAGKSVTVLLGQGDGSFTEATSSYLTTALGSSTSPLAVGNDPAAVVIADLNGDGIADLAVANQEDNTLTVLFGQGDGSFTAASGSPFAASGSPKSVGVIDVNGDGLSDLLVLASNSNSVGVYRSQLSTTAKVTLAGAINGASGTEYAVDAAYLGNTVYASSTSSGSINLNGAAPASLAAVGSTTLNNGIGASFPVNVVVEDASGVPLAGVAVSFSVTAASNGASATLSGPSAVSNASGIASVTATANSTVGGAYSIKATYASLTPVSFSLTNSQPASLSISATHSSPIFQSGPGVLTLIVSNSNGKAILGAATISDTVDPAFTIHSASSGCSVSGQIVTCTLATGSTASSTAFSIYVTASASAATSITNTATLTDSLDTVTTASSTDSIPVASAPNVVDTQLTQMSLSGSTDNGGVCRTLMANSQPATLTASFQIKNTAGPALTNPYAANVTLTGGNTLISQSASPASVAIGATVTFTFHIQLATCNKFTISFDVLSN